MASISTLGLPDGSIVLSRGFDRATVNRDGSFDGSRSHGAAYQLYADWRDRCAAAYLRMVFASGSVVAMAGAQS